VTGAAQLGQNFTSVMTAPFRDDKVVTDIPPAGRAGELGTPRTVSSPRDVARIVADTTTPAAGHDTGMPEAGGANSPSGAVVRGKHRCGHDSSTERVGVLLGVGDLAPGWASPSKNVAASGAGTSRWAVGALVDDVIW
jgi:hypothetical protein